ncbi:hypothetical protein V2I01_04985 [Micromonospora sp. BRA006-A]|nr:hypothetical protein [Micromonospora sp. BRA006-A]
MFGRSGLSWVPVDDSFVLSCGDAALIVRPAGEPDRWRAINVPRAGAPAILGDKLTLEYAQGVAEEFAQAPAPSSPAPTRRGGPGRSAPQRRLLDSLRLGPAATSGEASDLIAAHHARRALARITRNGVAA